MSSVDAERTSSSIPSTLPKKAQEELYSLRERVRLQKNEIRELEKINRNLKEVKDRLAEKSKCNAAKAQSASKRAAKYKDRQEALSNAGLPLNKARSAELVIEYMKAKYDKEFPNDPERAKLMKDMFATELPMLGVFNKKGKKAGVKQREISKEVLFYGTQLAQKLGKVAYQKECILRSALPHWDLIRKETNKQTAANREALAAEGELDDANDDDEDEDDDDVDDNGDADEDDEEGGGDKRVLSYAPNGLPQYSQKHPDPVEKKSVMEIEREIEKEIIRERKRWGKPEKTKKERAALKKRKREKAEEPVKKRRKKAAEVDENGEKRPRKKRVWVRKEKDAPKGPLNAYVHFYNFIRGQILSQAPDLATGEGSIEVTRLAGSRWKELTPDEKLPYLAAARKDKERFNKEMASYNAKKAKIAK